MSLRKSRVRKYLGAAAVVLLGAAVGVSFPADQPATDWTAPSSAARKPNPVPADAASIAVGKEVYAKNCLACHGPSGKGDGPAAFALDTKPRDLSDPKIAAQSDGSIFWKLTNGKKPMPTFETLIPETQRWQVINYVRTLQPQVAASSSLPASQPASQAK